LITRWDDPDAVRLRDEMTAEVGALYADEPALQNRDGSFDVDPSSIVATALVHEEGSAVGHVALRRLGDDLEIKRMYVEPARRGGTIADDLLAEVEQAARDLGAPRVILHTGERQRAAVAFYRRHGYTPIPVYPPYEDVAYSLCFEKIL
jgi:GNAT superfamily N-acetyltransferase